eukprot:767510-Hanusia_phi.AAC.3
MRRDEERDEDDRGSARWRGNFAAQQSRRMTCRISRFIDLVSIFSYPVDTIERILLVVEGNVFPVKSKHNVVLMFSPCPVFDQKGTSHAAIGMEAKGRCRDLTRDNRTTRYLLFDCLVEYLQPCAVG